MSTKLSFFKFFLVFSTLISFTACNFDSGGGSDEQETKVNLFASPRTVLENMDVDFPDYYFPPIEYANGEPIDKSTLNGFFASDVSDEAGNTLLTQTLLSKMKNELSSNVGNMNFNKIKEFSIPIISNYDAISFSVNILLTKMQILYVEGTSESVIYAVLKIRTTEDSECGSLNFVIKCKKNDTTSKLDVSALLVGNCYISAIQGSSEQIVTLKVKNYYKLNCEKDLKTRTTLETTKVNDELFGSSSSVDTLAISENIMRRCMDSKIAGMSSYNYKILRKDYSITKVGDFFFTILKPKNLILIMKEEDIAKDYLTESDRDAIKEINTCYREEKATEADFDSSLVGLLEDVFFQ